MNQSLERHAEKMLAMNRPIIPPTEVVNFSDVPISLYDKLNCTCGTCISCLENARWERISWEHGLFAYDQTQEAVQSTMRAFNLLRTLDGANLKTDRRDRRKYYAERWRKKRESMAK